MLRERSGPAPLTRCPWCMSGEPGGPWITCPRDSTPIHATCLREFRVCPVCREEVDEPDRAVAPDPAAQPSPAGEAGRPRIRIQPQRDETGIEPLPAAVHDALAGLARDYALHPVAAVLAVLAVLGSALSVLVGSAVALVVSWPLGVAAALAGAATLASAVAMVAVWLLPVRPRVSALVPAGAPPAALAQAERIVSADRDALAARRQFDALAARARSLASSLARLEDGRAASYLERLQAATPIEDAQRVGGIGPGIVGILRDHGIESLRGLLVWRGHIHGIGPVRSALLEEWARDRLAAIGRLVERGSFAERAALDREYDARLAPAREEAERVARGASELRAALAGWAAARAEAKAALERALARGE